jgi:hypothetical protein
MYYLVNVDHNATADNSAEVTMKGCKKCCISNAVDGTDEDMLWNGSEENGNVKSEDEKDECTDCEDGDSDTDWW